MLFVGGAGCDITLFSGGRVPQGNRITAKRILASLRLRRNSVDGVVPVIIEMRTYKTKPRMRSQFLEVFRSKTIPAFAEIGMTILGPFLSVEDPDTFFFMRGFPDLSSREPMKGKFYEGELWKRELEKILLPMLEKYEAVGRRF